MTDTQDTGTHKLPRRNCDACNTEYQPKRATSKYCSDKCRYDQFKYTDRERIPDDLRWDTLSRDNFRCVYCGATPADEELRVDHIVPINEGGAPLDPDNLATACHRCNSGKSDENFDPDTPVVAHITNNYDR